MPGGGILAGLKTCVFLLSVSRSTLPSVSIVRTCVGARICARAASGEGSRATGVDESGRPSLRTAPSGLDGAKDEKGREACGAEQWHKTSLRRVFPVLRYTLSPKRRRLLNEIDTLRPGYYSHKLSLCYRSPRHFCVPTERPTEEVILGVLNCLKSSCVGEDPR
ncbi:hypothetical protein C8J57DRAFT_1583323 [Mycena rebaudengoi]|nr:hypothetical protein C8J57DRAFT_1583323 [Mycena rebaudengoi]